jgi:hypothetical protein
MHSNMRMQRSLLPRRTEIDIPGFTTESLFRTEYNIAMKKKPDRSERSGWEAFVH